MVDQVFRLRGNQVLCATWEGWSRARGFAAYLRLTGEERGGSALPLVRGLFSSLRTACERGRESRALGGFKIRWKAFWFSWQLHLAYCCRLISSGVRHPAAKIMAVEDWPHKTHQRVSGTIVPHKSCPCGLLALLSQQHRHG